MDAHCTPTVLLVHGAFADASGWAGVIAELGAFGVPDVSAPANPLRGLASDAAYVASVAGQVDGPVLLVGHSYGGAVIGVAGAAADNVIGLVYVAGFALAEGESCAAVAARFPSTLLAPSVRPAPFRDGSSRPGVDLYLRLDAFREGFAADVPEATCEAMARTQRPVTAAAFEEEARAAAWRSLPSRYVVAAADRVLHPEAQRFMAARAGASTVEVDGSHAVFVSHPATIAEQIALAARPRTAARA